MATVKPTRTKTAHYKCKNYKVSLVVEFYKELVLCARSGTEAMELAEARLRKRHSSMSQRGFVIGDVEFIKVEEHE